MSTTQQSLEDKALMLAVGSDDLGPWMLKPFHVDGWNAATNAHVLVGYKGEPIYDAPDNSDEAKQRISTWLAGEAKHWASGTLKAEDIEKAMKAWPMADDLEQVKCTNCNDEHLDEDGDECYVCDGTGMVDGDTVIGKKPDLTEKLCIKDVAYFMPGVWQTLSDITKALGIERYTITHGSKQQFMRLEAHDSLFVLLLMPCLPDFVGTDGPFMTIVP